MIFLVVSTLIIGGLGGCALNVEININNNFTENEDERDTHTVLGEFGTATTCGYCKFAHGALKELYAEGQLDFYYVSLVTDKNYEAYCRTNEYNVYGFPTVWWDGGFEVDIGATSIATAKSVYTASINSALNREVYNIDIDLEVIWFNITEIKVDINITNNEDFTYDGRIRVYITEKISSRGWKDTDGNFYTYTFLDWAFNETISISAGSSWNKSMTWNGSAQGYPTVSPENTFIIAVIFYDEWHQGYSWEPPSNPFDAYYTDEVVGIEPSENQPPNQPIVTGPTDGEPGIEYEYLIDIADPDDNFLDIWIDWGDVTQGWLGPYPTGDTMNIIHAWDEAGIFEVRGKTRDSYNQESEWSELIVVSIGNVAPNKPIIEGPKNGLINSEIEFTFSAKDPNNDNIYFYIDWGDGTTEEENGPHSSGAEITFSHVWEQVNTFTIKVKAKDTFDLEGPWSEFEIKITNPRYRALLRFINIFPILKKILTFIR